MTCARRVYSFVRRVRARRAAGRSNRFPRRRSAKWTRRLTRRMISADLASPALSEFVSVSSPRQCRPFSPAPRRERIRATFDFARRAHAPTTGVTPDPGPGSGPGDTAESSLCCERIQSLGSSLDLREGLLPWTLVYPVFLTVPRASCRRN